MCLRLAVDMKEQVALPPTPRKHALSPFHFRARLVISHSGTYFAKLFGYRYFAFLKNPRLAATARVLFMGNMTDAYSRREGAYLEGRLGLERFWNAVLVSYMLQLVCVGCVKAQTGRRSPPQRDNFKVRD
jgi:hypothetical protein